MPNLDEAASNLTKSIIESSRQNHATIVMVLITTLEFDLERCLLRSFRPLNGEMKKRIFGAYGPASSFAAKIDLAFALGITTEAVHQELNKMRKIRNAFAHTKHRLSLDTEPVKTMFYALARPADIKGTYPQQFVKCGVLIDDHLEAYLVSKGETEDLRALEKPSETTDDELTKDAKPTAPLK